MGNQNIRLLTATPQEILGLNAKGLIEGIRRSEGRIIIGHARTRSANLIDSVSNPELVAAFGADIVLVSCFNVADPIIPGLGSKDPTNDIATKDIQVPLGKGYSLRELRQLIGRPVGVLLICDGLKESQDEISGFGNVRATVENARKAMESGADLLAILINITDVDEILRCTKEIKKTVGDNCVIELFRTKSGALVKDREIAAPDELTADDIALMIEAGADIIGFPAPGTCPGWTVETCSEYVKAIHKYGALASSEIHTSQEGSDVETIRQIALWSKMTGADMHGLGDVGYNECMSFPENLITYGIAIRGRRHQYRRMGMSINR